MSTSVSTSEPAADLPPVRRFLDRAYVPQAATLGELRGRIDELDAQIVALLAQRALCVRDATRFKRDPHQVAAPARQAQVFQRVAALAAQAAPDYPGFADTVADAYKVLVAGFIAAEARFFEQTEVIAP